jgi:YbbR domain-containing protein
MMLVSPLRWLAGNLGTLLLSFALAVVVWISAVTSENPNVERSQVVPIEILNKDPDMLIVGTVPKNVRLTIRATQSVWDQIVTSENALRAWVDLSGLQAGAYNELPVQAIINPEFSPARITNKTPETVSITLEPLASQQFPAKLDLIGDPATGYERGIPARSPAFVTVSGRESLVMQVVEVRAVLDISDSRNDIQTRVPLSALDANGQQVQDVTITPGELTVSIPITLQEAYRTVVVRVVTQGNVGNGYRITNISVTPPSVLVFSNDPQKLKDLPGFVETQPLDLTGAEDDIETFVELNLPDGVSVADGDSSVLVQVFIAAIEGSVTISLPVTPLGLVPNNAAELSPRTVDVILSGPVPVLNKIKPSDIRVVADLKGLDLGTHQVDLSADVVPDKVSVESILPSTVEVTIGPAATPTPTGLPTSSGTPQP